MTGTFLDSLDLLQALTSFRAAGAEVGLFFAGVSFLAFLALRLSIPSGLWIALVGSLAGVFVAWGLFGAVALGGWGLLALGGTGLLLWLLGTPAFSGWRGFQRLAFGFAGWVFVVDLCRGLALFGALVLQAVSPDLDLLLLICVLAVLFLFGAFQGWKATFWPLLFAAYLIAKLGLVALSAWTGGAFASVLGAPLASLTALALVFFLLFLSWQGRTQGPIGAWDLVSWYRPLQGVALTHLLLILFTMATIYPVLWVVKMALTPQQGFSMGLNPVPEPLTQYITALRRGDPAASCYSRAMAQNFREVIGLSGACVDQICQMYRKTTDSRWLGQTSLCQSQGFREAFSLPKAERDKALAVWKTASLRPLQQSAPDLVKPMQGLLDEIQHQHQERLQRSGLFWRQLWNSILVALITTFLGVFLACTAAYAFSRFRFPGRQAGLMSFLVSQMFPGTLMMIPLYILMSRLGLLNQLLGLTLVYSTIAIPFCVWMLKGYFDTIPKEIEEAALIDGASKTMIFWKIVLPLARPAIAVTALFSFMTAWNEFILAATFMNDEASYTLPVMLQRYVGAYNTEWGHFAAGAILVSLPIIGLFFFLQKNLVSGLTAGSVKG